MSGLKQDTKEKIATQTTLSRDLSSLIKRGVGGSRTRDGGFAIRCLSHLATTP